jgi:hypothetical protein
VPKLDLKKVEPASEAIIPPHPIKLPEERNHESTIKSLFDH